MSDFLSRMEVEKELLDEKLVKLHSFINTKEFLSLNETSQNLLTRQRDVMRQYSSILHERIRLAVDS